MADLADVRTLISQANESFRTLRATIQFSRDKERYSKAWDRHWERRSQQGGRSVVISMVFVGDDDEPPSATEKATARLWIERPARFREEYEDRWGVNLTISDGQTLWRKAPRLGPFREEISEESSFIFTRLLLDPAPLVPGLALEVLGKIHHAGRHAHHVRGVPRQRVSWHDLYGLAPGADEYMLLIDAERGSLLRAGALLDGKEFAFSNVEEVAFDEELPSEPFVLERAPGERVRTREELAQQFVPVEVTLDEAIRRASFTLWLPKSRRAWRVRVLYGHPNDNFATPETVHLHYFHEKKGQLSITETARDESRGRSWEQVVRDGQEYRVWHDSGRLRMPTIIRFHEERTSIELQSGDLDREELFEIADSLMPATSPSP
jgi:outer membrane lipoprotein-sorting protein